MDATRKNSVGLSLVALLTFVSAAQSQNVYKDYVSDKHAQYSPFDHQQRGLVYKIHTGHAGIFGNCDDDRQKMVSPYIDWHCRTPDCSLGIRFVNELVSDMFRKNQRLTDGAGDCVTGRCERCNKAEADCHCDEANVANRRPVRYSHRMNQNLKRSENTQANRNFRQRSNVPPQNQPANSHQQNSTDSKYVSQAYSANQMNIPQGTSIFDRDRLQAKPSSASQPTQTRKRSNSNSLYSSIEQYRPIEERANYTRNRNLSQRTSVDPKYRVSQTNFQNRKSSSQAIQTRDQPRSATQQIDQSSPVPEDQFERFEKTIEQKKVNYRSNDSQNQSRFKLSSGGVYSRPNFSKPKVSSQEPAQDQRLDPRYFQFQRIGGSANR